MDTKGDDGSPPSPSADHPSSSSPQFLSLAFQRHQQEQQEMTQYTSHGGAQLVVEGGGGAMVSGGGSASELGWPFIFPPDAAACGVVPPWPLPLHLHSLNPPVHFSTTTVTTTTTSSNNNNANSSNNPIHDDAHDHQRMLASLIQPPAALPPYAAEFRRPAAVPYGYEGLLLPSDYSFGLAGLYMGGGSAQEAFFRAGVGSSSGVPATSMLTPFGSLQSEFSKMTAQEIMDAKALAASKSHSEAERRRRERINCHFAKLRSLLPNTTKTDKASLLAEVIQHVKELKRHTSEIAEESGPVPTESDELSVDVVDDEAGRFVVRASLCCDDKSDLLPELIEALKAMRLRTLKAEIVTLGGRVRNVLVIAGENRGCGAGDQQQHSIMSIQEALKAAMEKAATAAAASTETDHVAAPSSSAAGGTSSGGTKRQRTNSLSSILENRSI